MFSGIRVWAVVVLVALALSACGGTPAATPVPATIPAPTSASTAIPTAVPTAIPTATVAPTTLPTALPTPAGQQITDGLGRSVTIKAAPQRIVSLAPSVTEILFAIGAGAQVVGDTQYCNYPAEADKLPEIGGFSADTISIEAVVGLKPDLVIAGAASQKPAVDALEQLDIPVIVFEPNSFEAVYTNITQVGAITGHSQEAEQVVTNMRARVAAVTTKIATVPTTARPNVFWEVFDEPLYTSGPKTFIGQMIDLVGATNIFADATEDYPQISAEAVIERNPQVILGPSTESEKMTPAMIAQRPGWANIQAVRDKRIYLLDADMTTRPGPRLADALEALAKALYPEAFK